MRKNRWFVVVLALFVLSGFLVNPANSTAVADQEVQVFIDGIRLELDDPPIIQEGRTLVPMRHFFEALGADVSWDKANRIAVGTRGGVVVRIPIDSKEPTVDGEKISIEVAAQIIHGRTYIPLRFVGEALGDEVTWDKETRTVRINSRAKTPDASPEGQPVQPITPDVKPESQPDQTITPDVKPEVKPESGSKLTPEEAQALIDYVNQEYRKMAAEINSLADSQRKLLENQVRNEIEDVRFHCQTRVAGLEAHIRVLVTKRSGIEAAYEQRIRQLRAELAATGALDPADTRYIRRMGALLEERERALQSIDWEIEQARNEIKRMESYCGNLIQGIRAQEAEKIREIERIRNKYLGEIAKWRDDAIRDIRSNTR